MGKWKETKYSTEDKINQILPEGLKVKSPLPEGYIGSDTKLIFIDPTHGEYTTSIRGILTIGKSTHPKASAKRRAESTQKEFGYSNNFQSKTAKINHEKAFSERKEEIIQKQQATMLLKYGVKNAMQLEHNRERSRYNNPMKLEENKAKFRGKNNPMYKPENREKVLIGRLESEKNGQSKAENEVNKFVTSLGLENKKGFFGGADPKEVDCKINELKIGIEYNGTYYHSEAVGRDKWYHFDKMQSAKNNGYKLIQIFDFEWKNRNAQIKSFLRSSLGKNEIYINGRECEIVELDKRLSRDFLEKYHILGSGKIKYSYGLMYKNELVSLITLNDHHRKTGEIVLNRFVSKENITIRGGLTKLTAHAYKIHGKLTTFIDLRFSTGENWIKNGWSQVAQHNPDYFYYTLKTGEIISKQSRMKRLVNTPEDMTEHQHALTDGLTRVWDCGKLKLVYNKV